VAGKTEVLGENLPNATLSTINSTCLDPVLNPGLRGGKPATNRLRYGAAYSVLTWQRNLIDCCLGIHYSGNVLTEPLPNNEHLLTSLFGISGVMSQYIGFLNVNPIYVAEDMVYDGLL
jgi:hypothetical protein